MAYNIKYLNVISIRGLFQPAPFESLLRTCYSYEKAPSFKGVFIFSQTNILVFSLVHELNI